MTVSPSISTDRAGLRRYLTRLKCQSHNVTFEPGCRNHWHIHHHAAQILIAVGGRGYYQLEGEEPKELEPGQAVRIPPDVKHWHGAAPHEAFSHLAFMIADGTGDATNEWLEPVDPDAYGTLR